MARLQILELPEGASDERPPFVLVVDQYEPRRYLMGVDQEPVSEFEAVAEKIGARALLVFAETVDIPANDLTLSHVQESADGNVVRLRVEPDLEGFRERVEEEVFYAQGKITRALDSDDKATDALREQLNEARMWARHGYEIGQKHCSWSDHGVAPVWLTEGWPPHIDSCEHLKRAAELEEAGAIRTRVASECRAALADALGVDRLRDWDDIRNAAAGLRKERDEQAAIIERVRELHQPVEHRGQTICWACSNYDFPGQTTDTPPVAYDQCATLQALAEPPAATDA